MKFLSEPKYVNDSVSLERHECKVQLDRLAEASNSKVVILVSKDKWLNLDTIKNVVMCIISKKKRKKGKNGPFFQALLKHKGEKHTHTRKVGALAILQLCTLEILAVYKLLWWLTLCKYCYTV